MFYPELSKKISIALKKDPFKYRLEMNSKGFVPIKQLLYSIREKENFATLQMYDIYHVAKNLDKGKYEIIGDKIRALDNEGR